MTAPRSTAPNWLTGIVVALAVGWVAAQDDHAPHESPATTAARQQAQAEHSRQWAAHQVCAGRPHEWVDDTTLVCHRERPEPVATTAQVQQP